MAENKDMTSRARYIAMAVAGIVVLRALTRRRTPKPPRKPKRTVLFGADLTGANLQNAHWEGAVVRLSILKDADLTGANMQNATLQRIDLRGANLTNANLTGARLKGIACDKNTTLPDGTKWTRRSKWERFTDPKGSDFWQPEEPELATAEV